MCYSAGSAKLLQELLLQELLQQYTWQVSPFWFCVHLLDIVTKSKDLQSVTAAVTLNGSSLVMTTILGMIIVYVYAILGYVLFPDDFEIGDDEDAFGGA